MACKNCKCHIIEENLRKMDSKRFNELLNEMVEDEVCTDTQSKIQSMMDKITKHK